MKEFNKTNARSHISHDPVVALDSDFKPHP